MKRGFITLALAIFAILACTSAFAVSPQQSWLDQSFDLGDIRGGYDVSITGANAQVYGNLSTSVGTITSASAYLSRNVYLDQGTKKYYSLNLFFSGTYDVLPAITNGVNGDLSLTHHGVTLHESSGINSYRDWLPTDTRTASGPIWSTAGSSIQLDPFTPTSANAYFQEYSYYDSYDKVTRDTFNYNINVTGYTDSLLAATMFDGLAPMQVGAIPTGSSVPEPASLSVLGLGIVGLFIRRRRQG